MITESINNNPKRFGKGSDSGSNTTSSDSNSNPPSSASWSCSSSCPHLQELLPDLLPPVSPALMGGTIYQHHILEYYKQAVLRQENAIPLHLRSQDVESYFTVSEMVAIVKEDWLLDNCNNNMNNNAGIEADDKYIKNMYVGEDGKVWALSEGMSGSIGEFYDVLPMHVVDQARSLYGDKLIRPPNSFGGITSPNGNHMSKPMSLTSETMSLDMSASLDINPKALFKVKVGMGSSSNMESLEDLPRATNKKLNEKLSPSTDFINVNSNVKNIQDELELDAERFHQLESLEAKLKTPSTTFAKRTSLIGRNSAGKNSSQGEKKRKTNSGVRRKGLTISSWCTEQFKDWLKQLDYAPIYAAEQILERIRQNRRNLWLKILKEDRNKEKSSTDLFCCECNAVSFDTSTPLWGSNVCNHLTTHHEDLDNLMQCLTCGKVFCMAESSSGTGSRHIMEHFISSGHALGMTCGKKGSLFCMMCGDFIYNSIVDRTVEYTEIALRLPQLGCPDQTLERSISSSERVLNETGKLFWPGLMATYPDTSFGIIRRASRQSLKRMRMFHGEMERSPWVFGYLNDVRNSKDQTKYTLPSPVGIHNLGNTCYLSSVLQVLLFTPLLQDVFIQKVGHDHLSCKIMRCVSRENCDCLACELDEIFIKVVSSTRGMNVVSILETIEKFRDSSEDQVTLSKNLISNLRGLPISPSKILQAVWNERSMKHIAGYAQTDAHEFLLAFLDTVGKHIQDMYSKARELSSSLRPRISRCATSDKFGENRKDVIKSIFEGSLRSVLLCEKCGCRRFQNESFTILSLPLLEVAPSEIDNATTAKIDLYACLDAFCQTEQLHSLVFCPCCNDKTSTRKQLAFEKFPKVLCIHLKRFDALSSKKISDSVEFSSELKVGCYLSQWRDVEPVVNTNDDLEMKDLSPRVEYDLYGTINHKGSLHQGHYTANVKAQHTNHWYHCSDEFVCNAGKARGEKEVLDNDEPYMLFYNRRKFA